MAHLYTYTGTDRILYLRYIYKIVFFLGQCCRFICFFYFLPTIHPKLFSFYKLSFSVDISKVYVMLSTRIQYSSAFYLFLNKEMTSAETATKLDIISSIWGNDHIRRLDGKTGNAYGVIKFYKVSMLLRLLLTYWGRRVCIFILLYVNKEKSHTTRYQ